MKTIGIIGGMSWESTVSYYQAINRGIKSQLGGLHSAKIVLASVNFAEYEVLQHQGQWNEIANLLTIEAVKLEQAGADFIVIATNTMHLVADDIRKRIRIPVLHIADATGQVISKTLNSDGAPINSVALLGTAFTMEKPFYRERLSHQYGLNVLIPGAKQRKEVHRIIYDELCQGLVLPESKRRYLEIIEQLITNGAEGIILGCTEIGLLLQSQDCSVELFDTAEIHAQAAVNRALS